MYLIFMDESGYNSKKQPFFVLSGVAIQSSEYAKDCDEERYRKYFAKSLPRNAQNKEKEEPKFRVLYKYWQRGEIPLSTYNNIINTFMMYPHRHLGKVILVSGNKEKFRRNPPRLSEEINKLPGNWLVKFYAYGLKLMLERVEKFLDKQEDYGIILYDQGNLAKNYSKLYRILRRRGSRVTKIYPFYYSTIFRFTRIIEFAFADSRNSVGIQVADFYAGITYHYKINEIPENVWKRWVWNNLDTCQDNPKKVEGCGYKEYP